MKILALRLMNVRRFSGMGVKIEGIGDGVNVLCAANEFGKSTSFDALHALFFVPHTSMGNEVKRLRPYSGGNPIVQADILTAAGRFRITKQYIGGKKAIVENLDNGRVQAQADEAERMISEIIRGGASGPAGLLWVRQGVTGLQEKERKEEESERRVRENLLTSVQGEVEAITGGRRMTEILLACEAELSSLVTPTRKPKAGSAFDATLKERDSLKDTVENLEDKVNKLRDALDKRTIAQKRLKELEDADEMLARRQAIQKAKDEMRTAEQYSEALKTAEAALSLAQERYDSSARELEQFRKASTQAGLIGSKLRDAISRREMVSRHRDEAVAAAQRAQDEVRAAEGDERKARGVLDRIELARRARQAALEIEGLRQRLVAAEAAREAIERAEAEFALLDVPEGTIEALQSVDVKIASLRATEAASLPTVKIGYNQPDTQIVLDGRPMDQHEERFVRDLAQVQLPGIGELTIRSNRPASAIDDLKRAEKAREDLLAALGVTDLAEARRRQVAAQAKSSELTRLRLELSIHAPNDLPHLREEIGRRASEQKDVDEPDVDPEQATEAAERAVRRVDEARIRAHELQVSSARAQDMVVEIESVFATLKAQLDALDAELGPEPARIEREAQLAARHAQLRAAFESLNAEVQAKRSTAPDLKSMDAVLRRLESVDAAASDEMSRLKLLLAGLNGEITTHSNGAVEEELGEAKEALESAHQRVTRFETEVAMLAHLRTVLQNSRSAARDFYLQPVLTELRPLLGLLFDDISVVFDDKTLLPNSIRRNGLEEDIDRLSGGMKEQLSVLTRLAFARLLAKDGRPAPVILDDALVYSDDDRIERMFDALHRQADDQQIIVFSCRQRAFARLGGNVLQMESWAGDLA